MKFTADFETCTWLSDKTYVWAWACCNIEDEKINIGNSMETFFEFIKSFHNPTFYFHNLKFDGEFIIYHLLKNGYEWVNDKNKRSKTFTTLINQMGQFYTITIYEEIKNKHTKKITFIDSLKILPFSVSLIAKSFKLPISKLEIDYNEPREIGHILTREEEEYIKNDVLIVAKALKVLFDEGLEKMTQASNALFDYKKLLNEKRFKRLFPKLTYEIDADIRKSYKGGFTYLNPIYKEKDVKEGYVLDVNSLYPSVMYNEALPFGEPYFYEGKYKEDKVYPLYIQMITCSFELKENKIPTIQIKNSMSFKGNEYLTSSNNEIVTLVLTNVDLDLFLEHYNVYDLTYLKGWKFKSLKGVIFKDYIDKWIKVKNESTLSGNFGMRTLAKLMLNALYGKFATTLKVQSKMPYLENDIVKYKVLPEEQKDGIYIPIGAFITAYARNKTIRTSQAIKEYSIKNYGKDLYCYSDTDSIHTLLDVEELKKFCEIDDVELGKWKVEGHFTKARFVRQKTYLEEFINKEGKKEINITCAGLPERCYPYVKWKEFKEGFKCGGKLMFSHIKGGVKLIETDFTIKSDKPLLKSVKKF